MNSMQDFIESKKGTFYKEYSLEDTNGRKRKFVEYKCENGHEQKKRSDSVKKGWCENCVRNTIEDAHALAHRRRGKFLSEIYKNVHTNYNWECEFGHKFQAAYNNVYAGKWCIQCQRYTLEDMQNLAAKHEGKFLSLVYTSASEKYQWQCKEMHIWTTCAASIIHGSWCAECRVTISERTCKKIIEYIYKQPFIKLRPSWLISSENTRLELDAYNEELKTALEYNGKQHVEYVPYFFKSEKQFERRKKLDQEKVNLCKQNNVHLISVPHTIKHEDLYSYILLKCLNVPKDTPKFINYKELDLNNSYSTDKIQEINALLESEFRGARLLSTQYFHNLQALEFECKNGHLFQQTWSGLRAGSFCKKCTWTSMSQKCYDTFIVPFCQKYSIYLEGTYERAKAKHIWCCTNCSSIRTETSWDSLRKSKSITQPCICALTTKTDKPVGESTFGQQIPPSIAEFPQEITQ